MIVRVSVVIQDHLKLSARNDVSNTGGGKDVGGRLDARVKPDVTKLQVVLGADSPHFVKKVKACDDRLPLQWSPFAYVIKYSIYGGKLSVPRKNTNSFF